MEAADIFVVWVKVLIIAGFFLYCIWEQEGQVMRYDARQENAPYLVGNKQGVWRRVPRRRQYVLLFSNGRKHHKVVYGQEVPEQLYRGVIGSA